jgi:glycosyltransferase involved in cell wall biosynthesis
VPSPLKITYVYDTPMPDREADTEQVVNTVASMARRGLDMALLIPGPATGGGDHRTLLDYYQTSGDFALWHLALRYHAPRRSLRLFEKWSHALRSPRHPSVLGADLVYTRNLPAVFANLRAGRRVVYEHFRPWGDQFPWLRPWLRHLLLQPGVAGCVFHSQHTRESFVRIGIPEEKTFVAHNGWDPRRMEPRLTREAARRRLGLPLDQPIGLYAGRMNHEKGLDVLLAVARGCPEVRFLLVGSEGEGPVEVEARTLPNTQVVPWQRFADLAPWLYAADALIIPPSLDPLHRHGNTVLPLKLFLYLAAGRPIIAPAAPDTAELLSDGVTAALVTPGDVAGTIATLRALVSDRARATRLGDAALDRAASLTWDGRAAAVEGFVRGRMARSSS